MSGGVDALLEKDPVQKEWQDVKTLAEAEAVEAKAQERAASGLTAGEDDGCAGSSASAGASEESAPMASAADFLDNLAKEHVRAYVKLVPEPSTMAGVEQSVRQSGLSDIRGLERRSVVMATLSADSLGEVAGRAPHRRAPVDFELVRKLVQGALLGRGGSRDSDENPVTVPAGDLVALHDGGRPTVQQMFLDIWKPTRKVSGAVVKNSAMDVKVKKLTLVMNEETVRQLKSRVRGANAYTLVHTCTFVSDMELVPDMCPEKARCHYTGYNVGDALGFINLENYGKVWQAENQKKRDIYGARMIQLKDGGDEAAGPLPKQDDLQPVFFHALPAEYYLECIHSYSLVGILDLSCGGGQVAQACLTKRIPYMGFCLTETHVVELEKFLVAWVKDMMCTEGHPLCRKGAAAMQAKVPTLWPNKEPHNDNDTGDDKKKDYKKDNKRKSKAVSSSESSEPLGRKRKQTSAGKKKKKKLKKRSSDESASGASFS